MNRYSQILMLIMMAILRINNNLNIDFKRFFWVFLQKKKKEKEIRTNKFNSHLNGMFQSSNSILSNEHKCLVIYFRFIQL